MDESNTSKSGETEETNRAISDNPTESDEEGMSPDIIGNQIPRDRDFGDETGYDPNDPKHPDHYERMVDIWDNRE